MTGNVRDFAVRGPVNVQCAFVIVRGLLLSIPYFSALSMCRIYDSHYLNLVPILSTAVKFIYNLLAIALSDMSQTGSEAQRNCVCDDVTTSTESIALISNISETQDTDTQVRQSKNKSSHVNFKKSDGLEQ